MKYSMRFSTGSLSTSEPEEFAALVLWGLGSVLSAVILPPESP